LSALGTPVTSFGAAIAGGKLFAYGGHLGNPHEYAAGLENKQLQAMSLQADQGWEVVSEGPPRTGLALVGFNDKLYRLGGFEARNAQGAEWDLYSSRDFARFDVASGKWTDLAPLPEGRSSHDAALLGSQLYLIGGWEMKGKGDTTWLDTAYVCDLAADKLEWTKLPPPPFKRRALSVATHGGQVWAIGGMEEGGMTLETAFYDPQAKTWQTGPTLPGKTMDGFGTSSFGTKDGLFVVTASGAILRLSNDGKQWEEAGRLKHPRMFSRLVADDEGTLYVVGGTSRGGKVKEVEAIRVTLARAK
jgi:N-acetylneuraminic acid mutarotase